MRKLLASAFAALLVGLALVWTQPPAGAWLIQRAATTPTQAYLSTPSTNHHFTSQATPFVLTLNASIPTGATAFICLNAGSPITSVTDNAGSPNSYSELQHDDPEGGSVWGLANISGNATTISFAFGGGGGRTLDAIVDFFSGPTTLDVSSLNTQTSPGTGTDVLVSGAATTTGTDVKWGCAIGISGTQPNFSAGTGFTPAQALAATWVYTEYKLSVPSGNQQLATFSLSNAGTDTYDTYGATAK